MAAAGAGFLSEWRRTLPQRWRGLVRPYCQALAVFLVGYAGATGLLAPWALGRWWSLGVPLVAGFGVCWWLWRPWALLARNSKGETRRTPLLITWVLLVALGWNLRDYVRYRWGEVREVASVRDLAQPGTAVFYRLHGAFYIDRPHLGRYYATRHYAQKNVGKRYEATGYYACPLRASAADTAAATAGSSPAPPIAWLTTTYQAILGDNLTQGEHTWRYTNFVARSNARYDSLPLAGFAYLLREDAPAPGLYAAVQASRLAPHAGLPLLLRPMWAPLAQRGTRTRRRLRWVALGGNAIILLLLLVMPLRPDSQLLAT